MAASLDPLVLSEATKDSHKLVYLVQIPGPFFITDNDINIDYNGQLYVNSGLLLDLSTIVREEQLKLHSYHVTVSNAETTLYQTYAAQNHVGEYAEILGAFIDSAGQIVGAPLVLYQGTLDIWEVSSENRLTLKLTSPWAAFEITAGRYTSPNSQERYSPGDQIFNMAHEERSSIGWGVRE
jgi:hypothetical protein